MNQVFSQFLKDYLTAYGFFMQIFLLLLAGVTSNFTLLAAVFLPPVVFFGLSVLYKKTKKAA